MREEAACVVMAGGTHFGTGGEENGAGAGAHRTFRESVVPATQQAVPPAIMHA